MALWTRMLALGKYRHFGITDFGIFQLAPLLLRVYKQLNEVALKNVGSSLPPIP